MKRLSSLYIIICMRCLLLTFKSIDQTCQAQGPLPTHGTVVSGPRLNIICLLSILNRTHTLWENKLHRPSHGALCPARRTRSEPSSTLAENFSSVPSSCPVKSSVSLRLISLSFSFRLSLSISLWPESQAECRGFTGRATVRNARLDAHGASAPPHLQSTRCH